LISLFVLYVFASLRPSLKTKIFNEEPNALTIEFLGSCDLFNGIAPSITINSFPVAPNLQGAPTDCLPIDDIKTNPDFNNLKADYICNGDHEKSIIRILEVYTPSLAPSHPDTLASSTFILGIHSVRPFRAYFGGDAKYIRRPKCSVFKDFCNPSNSYVKDCEDTEVHRIKGYVLNDDLVYVLPYNFNIGTCRSYKNNAACCAYISPSLNGICPNYPTKNLFKLYLEREKQEDPQKEELKEVPQKEAPQENPQKFAKLEKPLGRQARNEEEQEKITSPEDLKNYNINDKFKEPNHNHAKQDKEYKKDKRSVNGFGYGYEFDDKYENENDENDKIDQENDKYSPTSSIHGLTDHVENHEEHQQEHKEKENNENKPEVSQIQKEEDNYSNYDPNNLLNEDKYNHQSTINIITDHSENEKEEYNPNQQGDEHKKPQFTQDYDQELNEKLLDKFDDGHKHHYDDDEHNDHEDPKEKPKPSHHEQQQDQNLFNNFGDGHHQTPDNDKHQDDKIENNKDQYFINDLSDGHRSKADEKQKNEEEEDEEEEHDKKEHSPLNENLVDQQTAIRLGDGVPEKSKDGDNQYDGLFITDNRPQHKEDNHDEEHEKSPLGHENHNDNAAFLTDNPPKEAEQINHPKPSVQILDSLEQDESESNKYFDHAKKNVEKK